MMFTFLKELWRQRSDPPIWATGTDGNRYRFACYLKNGTALWVRDEQQGGFYFTQTKNEFTETGIPFVTYQ